MLRNMVTSLFRYEQIETTEAKAKSLKPVAEKMIGLAKRGDLHARRQALAYMQDKSVAHRLFDELKDRYMDRSGGYVRIVKKTVRKGDGAHISIVQLLPADEVKKSGKKKSGKSKTGKAKGKPQKKEEIAEKQVADTQADSAAKEKKVVKTKGEKPKKKPAKSKKMTKKGSDETKPATTPKKKAD
jgi:large subunit ribosomal protein L17